jgi:Mn-dependent DtxR family transcriptional regulator
VRHRTIEQLARVATIYRLAIEDGRSPVDEVARRLQITPGAAKRRIRRARESGQLAALTRSGFDNPG